MLKRIDLVYLAGIKHDKSVCFCIAAAADQLFPLLIFRVARECNNCGNWQSPVMMLARTPLKLASTKSLCGVL